MTEYKELAARLRALADERDRDPTADIREAASAIEALEAERDEARMKLREMHRRAQRAEGSVAAALGVVRLWMPMTKIRQSYLMTEVLGMVHRRLSRRIALQENTNGG